MWLSFILTFIALFAPPAVSGPTVGAAPNGFGAVDRFDNADTACAVLTGIYTTKENQAQVYSWCMRRTRASTRGRKLPVSRVDGSAIHDRDRPAARAIYAWGVRSGRLDPVNCEHDRYDSSIRRPKAAKHLANNWPFENPVLTEEKRKRWIRSPYDVEKFGTRGPHDSSIVVARGVLPGCWAPEAMDRFDVSVAVTVLRAAKICEKHGCRNNAAIKARW